MIEEDNNQNTELKRPPQLTLLCVLSFISGGISIIGYLYFFGLYDQIVEMAKEGNIPQFFGEEVDYSFLIEISRTYYLWSLLLYISSVIGVFLIWNLNGIGFHVYALSQVLLLIIPEIYITAKPFPFFDIMITILFILLYFKNLKLLGRL